jgi:hypothetical protein
MSSVIASRISQGKRQQGLKPLYSSRYRRHD